MGYTLTYNGETITLNAAATAYTVSGLVNNTQYGFTLRAFNVAGGGATATRSTTPRATRPAAPTGLSAQEGDGVITLTWSAPANTGGATITAYIVYVNGTATLTVVGLAATLTLPNGAEQSVGVAARNSVGVGAAAGTTATPRGAPYAPENLEAKGTESAITLTWEAPNNGGYPIVNYVVEYNGTTTMTQTTMFVLTGLTKGDRVTFMVRAQNSAGAGAAATVVGVARGAPDAPVITRADRGDRTAILEWRALVGGSLNESTLSGYFVTYATVGQGVATRRRVGAGVTAYTARNLVNGTRYTFSVFADSSEGEGAAAVTALTPAKAPNPPQNLTATRGNGRVFLAWTPVTGVSNTGGEAVTAYVVYVNNQPTMTVSAAAATILGLSNGTSYNFAVRAVNAVGESNPSQTRSAKPARAPDAPQNVTAQAGDKRATVRWDAPTGEAQGGEPIIEYHIAYAAAGGETMTITVSGGNASRLVEGLTNQVTYSFYVRAVNAAGTGSYSSPAATAQPFGTPEEPVGFAAAAGDGLARLSWSAPNDGGSPLLGYNLRWNGGQTTLAANAVAYTVTNLNNGTRYEFYLRARNQAGAGAEATAVVSPATTPMAPVLQVPTAANDTVVFDLGCACSPPANRRRDHNRLPLAMERPFGWRNNCWRGRKRELR